MFGNVAHGLRAGVGAFSGTGGWRRAWAWERVWECCAWLEGGRGGIFRNRGMEKGVSVGAVLSS